MNKPPACAVSRTASSDAPRRAPPTDQRLSEALESVTDAFCILDRDWRFTFLNGAAERLLQRPRSGLLGRDLWSELPATRGSIFERECRRALAENLPVRFEARFTPLDPWLEVRAFPSSQGVATYLLDVSARKLAEDQAMRLNYELQARFEERTAQLAEASRELEQARRELEAFNYSVSHDLRSPLRAIDGFSDALAEESGTALSPAGRRYLDSIHQGAGRMARLIDDLLDYSRLSGQAITRGELDMGGLAQAALGEVLDANPRAEVVIAPLPPCRGDPEMLRQVWRNLLSNALKFSSRHPSPRVEVGHRDRGDCHEFWVRDNGVGFDMRFASKLFGTFDRLHRGDDFPGTGVGLAIVRRALKRHGGEAWAEGAPGAGATFHFTLPKLEAA